MKMKENIKRIAFFIFNMKLGTAIILVCIIVVGFACIKSIYIDIKYHFSDVVFNIMFWVIGISGIFLIALIANLFIKKNKDDTGSI